MIILNVQHWSFRFGCLVLNIFFPFCYMTYSLVWKQWPCGYGRGKMEDWRIVNASFYLVLFERAIEQKISFFRKFRYCYPSEFNTSSSLAISPRTFLDGDFGDSIPQKIENWNYQVEIIKKFISLPGTETKHQEAAAHNSQLFYGCWWVLSSMV